MPLIDFNVDTVAYQGFKTHWGMERSVFTKQTDEYSNEAEADEIDADTFGARFSNMLPGIQKASSKIAGIHSGIDGQIGDVLRPLVGRATPLRAWSAFESLNVLAPIDFQPCSLKKYSVKSTKKEAVKFDAELTARGAFNSGFILVSPKSNTTMVATGNGSDDDSTSTTGATTFGGVVQMHLYDMAGGTTPTLAVVVQHSPDGTTWTTLQAFVTASTLNTATAWVQRINIPATTTINAHVRAQWTTTGTPTSVQGIVMYARGVDPDA